MNMTKRCFLRALGTDTHQLIETVSDTAMVDS